MLFLLNTQHLHLLCLYYSALEGKQHLFAYYFEVKFSNIRLKHFFKYLCSVQVVEFSHILSYVIKWAS